MAVYFVGRLKTEDWSWLREYGAATKALIEKHGGRYLAQGGKMEAVEGTQPLPSALVLIEFPDTESAHAWHEDPEYQPLMALRQANSELEMTLVEGV